MKHHFIHLAVLVAMPFTSTAQAKNDYAVKGYLPAYKNNQLKTHAVLTEGMENDAKSLTCELTGGTFSFKGRAGQPVQSILKIILKSEDGDSILELRSFWLEKGNIRINSANTLQNAVITGSLTQMHADSFQAMLLPKTRAMDSLYQLKRASKADSAYVYNTLNPAIKLAIDSMNATIGSFIASHPESYLSLQLLEDLMHVARQDKSRNVLNKEHLAQIDKLYAGLHATLRSTPAGKRAKASLDGLKAANVGDAVLHFALKGVSGTTVDTRKLKGQVYLIDFWGSWCGWCREGHPHLRELYARYKSKGFEIIGVSKEYDQDPDVRIKKWKKAVADDRIDWQHVLSEPGDQDLVTIYGVGAYPTKILVGRDGKILLRVTDDKERELDRLLAELFEDQTLKR